MEAFAWNERFVTGFDSVDAQHRRLFDLINRVGNQLIATEAAGQEKTEQVFHELAAYANAHFRDEEKLMGDMGLAREHVIPHVKAHREFVEQVKMLWSQRQTMLAPAETLHGFLVGWLSYHILGTDQEMAREIQKVRQGIAPDEAHADEHTRGERSTTALVQALHTMYRTVSALNRDLDAKVAARTQELLQSEKMASIGQLAAGVAHEINNPIGFVNSNLGTLGRYAEQLLKLAELGAATEAGQAMKKEIDLEYLRSDLTDLLKESQDGLNRVRKIVSNLKDFARVDEAEWQSADLLAGLESTLNVAAHEIKYKADIVRELIPLPPVRCIPAQINQVFLNLLVNAAQAIAQHGTITLKSGVEGERVWIEIIDTGCGMDEDTQRRVFEPFFTTKPVGTGTGLGMSVSYDIVKQHGGKLEIDSAPGQGTRMRLWLPVTGPQAG